MPCIIHADREATARCSGCAEALCSDCKVEIAGAAWCQTCKTSAIKQPPIILSRMHLASRAKASVLIGLVGLVFFTIVCGIVAIVMGVKALGEINEDPRAYGGGMAFAGITIGCMDLLFFVINLMNRP